MVCYYHNMVGSTLRDTALDKIQTFLVLGIKVGRCKATTIVQNLPKVIHPLLYNKFVFGTNVRPKRREDKIDIINPHNLVLVVMHIRQYLTAPAVTICQDIIVLVVFVVTWHN